MKTNSAIHANKEEYAASYSAYHTHFHDMPNFIREFYLVQDDMPKNVPRIPNFGVLDCTSPNTIGQRQPADRLIYPFLNIFLIQLSCPQSTR